MSLCDFLTDEELDACFYRYIQAGSNGQFGDVMHDTVERLMATGYRFRLLDESGVTPGAKALFKTWDLQFFLGKRHDASPLEIMQNGRQFIRSNAPELLGETDEEWALRMAKGRAPADGQVAT